jgi:plastocyanin
MRLLALSTAVVLSIAPVAPTPPATDLPGSTTLGLRPEPHAVVWMDVPGGSTPANESKVVLDQRNLDFAPHVLAVRVGTVVEFPNHDRVFHNVFSFHDGKRFDLGLYPVGTVRYVRFDHPGLSRILCNIHPNMAAFVMTVETPYFAVSDENGHFRIPGVPTGPHAYHAWRPGRPELSGTLSVEPGSSLDLKW